MIDEIESDDGWVSLAVVGQRLRNISPDFDSRNYGCPKLSILVRKTNAFDVDQAEGKGLRIRPKTGS